MTDLPPGKVRHIDFYPDEWLAGTATLDAVAIGVYISICALIYSHGGPVKIAEVRRFVKCHGNTFNAALRQLESLGKCDRFGDEIDVKRCRNELEKAKKRLRIAIENLAVANKTNGVAEPDRSDGARGRAHLTTNYQPKDSPLSPPSGGIRKNRNGKHAAPEVLATPPWQKRCAAWAKSGFWQPLWGPTPDEPNCLAPPALIAATLNGGHEPRKPAEPIARAKDYRP